MKNRRIRWSWLMFVSLIGAGMDVRAQAPTPTCESEPACLSLYDRAKQESATGNLPEAQRLYKLAYDVRPDPRLLFSIARVCHKLGRSQEAVSYYQQFIDSPVDDAEQKRKAQEYLSQLSPPPPPQQSTQASPEVLVPNLTAKIDTVPKPIYKKWWFWTAVGAGGLSIVAIGLGVGLSQRRPVDVNTYEPTF